MPPRKNNSITMMIAQAQEKMRELKELQFFGGDALNLKRYEYVINIPAGNTIARCYRFVMTPTKPGTTMPIDVGARPNNANTYNPGKVERVAKTNGTFEWLVMYDGGFGDDPARSLEFYVIYSGAATWNVEQLA